jgi:hypothetical protein
MADPVLSRVDKFLATVLKRPSVARGSVVLAIDATASRQPTWDAASHLLGQMFNEVAAIGSLDVQAVYFRGTGNIDAECKASNWLSDPVKLAAYMTGVTCRAGLTQITRVLDHTLRESDKRKIGALVYVGDSCEEPRDHLVPLARRLADLEIPIFIFQERADPQAEQAFRELAQITKGAFHCFDPGSAKQLGDLLRAVAAFAVGGVAALEQQGSAEAARLLGQIR